MESWVLAPHTPSLAFFSSLLHGQVPAGLVPAAETGLSEMESCLLISVQRDNLINASSPSSYSGKSGRMEIPGGVSLITKGEFRDYSYSIYPFT